MGCNDLGSGAAIAFIFWRRLFRLLFRNTFSNLDERLSKSKLSMMHTQQTTGSSLLVSFRQDSILICRVGLEVNAAGATLVQQVWTVLFSALGQTSNRSAVSFSIGRPWCTCTGSVPFLG